MVHENTCIIVQIVDPIYSFLSAEQFCGPRYTMNYKINFIKFLFLCSVTVEKFWNHSNRHLQLPICFETNLKKDQAN